MAKKEFLTYKNVPLVKCGNQIIYGNYYDPFIVEMTVLSTKTIGDDEVPDKINIKLLSTDENLSPKSRIKRETEKKGLNDAMLFAYTWLKSVIPEI